MSYYKGKIDSLIKYVTYHNLWLDCGSFATLDHFSEIINFEKCTEDGLFIKVKNRVAPLIRSCVPGLMGETYLVRVSSPAMVILTHLGFSKTSGNFNT